MTFQRDHFLQAWQFLEAQVPDWVNKEVTSEEGHRKTALKWWQCCPDTWLLVQEATGVPSVLCVSVGQMLCVSWDIRCVFLWAWLPSCIGSHMEATCWVKHHTGFFPQAASCLQIWFVTSVFFFFPYSIWRGPNVNCVDSTGYTPLHHAALNGHK